MKFILVLSFLFLQAHETSPMAFNIIPQEDLKKVAFHVLTTKCNVCHATKKKQDVFTLENMDSLANDINKQVFIKKKMPKGRKNTLSEQESNALKIWIDLVIQ